MADLPPASSDDLAILNDMFGKSSPALQDQIRDAHQKALEQTFSKQNPEPVKPQKLANKSAEESADVFNKNLKEEPIASSEPAMSSEDFLKNAGEQPAAMSSEAALQPPASEVANAASDTPMSAEDYLKGAAPKVEEAAAEAAPKAEVKVPGIIENLWSKAPDKETFIKAIGKIKSIGPEAAESWGEYLAGKAGSAVRMGTSDLGALGATELLNPTSTGGPGLTDYSPSTQALIKAKAAGTPPPTGGDETPIDLSTLNPPTPPPTPEAGNAAGPTGGPSQAAPTSAAGEESAPPPPSTSDYLKDLISKAYGGGMGDQALQAAQRQRNQLQSNALISKAGSELGSAFARLHGGKLPANTSVQDELVKEAEQPITDLAERRKAVMDQLQGGLKAADLVDTAQLRDPTSKASQVYRNAAAKLNPQLANVPGFEDMSAEGVKQLQPMIDLSIKAQVAKDNRLLITMQKEKMDSAKAKSDMGKAIATTMNRGAPMQAQNSVLSADKILDLFNTHPGDKNDQSNPSNWNSDKVHLYRTELEKLAKGGIPSEAGTKALIPNTVASTFANAAQSITGDTIGASQGAFIKNLMPYVQDVRKTSSSYVRDNVYKPIMNSYNRRILPEEMDDYKRSLPKEIFPEVAGAQEQQGPANKGTVPANVLKDYTAKHGGTDASNAALLKNGGYSVEGY